MSVAEVLSFDLRLELPGFTLQGAAEIPLRGITVISGPSGSGKTTLLRALAGLEPAARGHVRFGGRDWTQLPPEKRQVGFVFQDGRLFRHMNVERNIRYGARRRATPESELREVIRALDLEGMLARKPASLSGGEARRVALARALASRPRVLFLDEPMVGLDPERRGEVLPYITRAADEFGLAVLYVSHSQFEKGLLADRELPVSGGRIGAMRDGPARLELPVAEAGGGQVVFRVGGERLALPGEGEVGQLWELRPGHGSILAGAHPGATTAAAVLPVEAAGRDEAPRRVRVRIAGQEFSVPGERDYAPGEKLWLICPRLRGRWRGGWARQEKQLAK